MEGYLNRTATNGLFSATCNGIRWSSRMCAGAKQPSICTDVPFPGYGKGCKDPCGLYTPANPDPLCPNVNVLSPCSATGYACLAKAAPFTAFRVLSADFSPKGPAPSLNMKSFSYVARQKEMEPLRLVRWRAEHSRWARMAHRMCRPRRWPSTCMARKEW